MHNAVKFTRPGGLIRVATMVRDTDVVVEATDTGIGLEEESVDHIFGMFAQGPVPATRVRSGLGIGLALVRRVVEMHDGSISAHTGGAGLGSTFVVRLPTPP